MMSRYVQISDDGHMVEDGEKCWCNPKIIHRDNHVDDIIVHFNVGQDRNLTPIDVDNIMKVVDEYERGLVVAGEDNSDGEETP